MRLFLRGGRRFRWGRRDGVRLVVQSDDFVGDVDGRRRPQYRAVGNADIDHKGQAVAGSVLLGDGQQLFPHLLHHAALFLLEGGLIDVNNGFLYASMDAEGEGSILAPTFIIEEKEAVEQAKQAALKRFGAELLLRMHNLRVSSEQAAPPVAVQE